MAGPGCLLRACCVCRQCGGGGMRQCLPIARLALALALGLVGAGGLPIYRTTLGGVENRGLGLPSGAAPPRLRGGQSGCASRFESGLPGAAQRPATGRRWRFGSRGGPRPGRGPANRCSGPRAGPIKRALVRVPNRPPARLLRRGPSAPRARSFGHWCCCRLAALTVAGAGHSTLKCTPSQAHCCPRAQGCQGRWAWSARAAMPLPSKSACRLRGQHRQSAARVVAVGVGEQHAVQAHAQRLEQGNNALAARIAAGPAWPGIDQQGVLGGSQQ